jgi:hypothetical protein
VAPEPVRQTQQKAISLESGMAFDVKGHTTSDNHIFSPVKGRLVAAITTLHFIQCKNVQKHAKECKNVHKLSA